MNKFQYRTLFIYSIFVVSGFILIYGIASAFIPPSGPPPDTEPTNTIGVSRGGTGATTATEAINNLLPSQTGNSGKFITTDGANSSWAEIAGGGIGGGGTINYISKFTASGTIGNSQVFDNGTNVGIGTTDPLNKLEVNGSATGGITIRTDTLGNSYANRRTVLSFGQGPGENYMNRILTSTSGSAIDNAIYFQVGNGGATSYVTPLSMNGTGNVGIGITTGINSKLTVAGTVEATGLKLTTAPSAGYVLTSDASGVGTWQAASGGSGPTYLSSASCNNTCTAPADATFAVVQFRTISPYGGCNWSNAAGTGTIFRVGMTSVSVDINCYPQSGVSNGTQMSASWSGSTITISGGWGRNNNTVYFYK